MNISLPDSMKQFVDAQVEAGSYGTSSEYVRMLIRREQEREKLRELVLEGLRSEPTQAVDDDYFKQLRTLARAGRTG